MTSDPLPAIQGRLYHVGIVVRDVDAAMATYRSLFGIAAFYRIDTNYPARHRDWTGTIANRNTFGRTSSTVTASKPRAAKRRIATRAICRAEY